MGLRSIEKLVLDLETITIPILFKCIILQNLFFLRKGAEYLFW